LKQASYDQRCTVWIFARVRQILSLLRRASGATLPLAIAPPFVAACLALWAQSVWAETHSPASPEGFVGRAWGTEAGLPQNTVNAILQTQDGYLWLGTQGGLARFDGVRFTTYGLADGLPNVQVRVLYEDRKRDLWIATQGGLSRMRNGRIETFSAEDGLAGANVAALTEDANGRLWVGTTEGLRIWQSGKLVRPKAVAEVGPVRALWCDRHGAIWIATPRGLYEFQAGRLAESVGPPSNRIVTSGYCFLED